jgi:hypothetical protein
MKSPLRQMLTGILCALPVALLAGLFASWIFDPSVRSPSGQDVSLSLGPIRGIAFGSGALLAAAVIAPRLAVRDLGSFSGLFAFTGLAHLIALVIVAIEQIVRDPGSVGPAIVVPWLFGIVGTLGVSLIVWLPTGAVWVAAVRSLTLEDELVPSDLERADSEQMRREAARHHETVDALTPFDQGSKLYRNRD